MSLAAMRTLERGQPIGWNGRTLRQMLDDSEQLFAETGRYQGLDRLVLKETAPIRYEKIYSRIRGGVVKARETVIKIAASPIIEEMGELCFVLYSPEGDSVALSTGIIIHVHTMSDAIKYMIRNDYESNPGIRSGDIFVNNDPHIGNVHNADIQTLVPIFWEGECVGWAGGVTHELDVGARTPGSSAVGPINRLEDGIDLPAQKCGANDTFFRDYIERCKKAVRTPLYWTLDEKTRLAGCHMIRDVVLDVIRSEGIDTYKRFIREVIEEGRRSFLGRVCEQLIPGTYRVAAFIDHRLAGEQSLPEEAAKDGVLHAPIETRVTPQGRLELSFEGANAWGYHSFNCCPSSMQAGMWAVLAQTLMANDKVNDGAFFASSITLPPGSWTNPINTMTSHSDAWYVLVPAFAALPRALSRGWQARGYIEEIIAGWGDGNMTQGGGMDPFGEQSAISNMEVSCVGAGAGVVKDGLDFACAAWIPTGDMGDVEDWEVIEPLLYLGRRVKPSSAGMGRRRGGSGYDSLRMVWMDRFKLQNVGEGAVFCQAGLFGGYPAAAGYRHNVRKTNLPGIFEARQPYPSNEPDPGNSEISRMVKGEEVFDKRTCTMPEPYERYDLYLSFVKGGPGLGDPLERRAEDVERDLNEGFLLPALAERVYGAVFEKRDDAFVVDSKATEERRNAIREERRRRAVPVRDWIARERETRVLAKKVIEPIAEMYRSSMALSESWARQYRAFWNLPDNFTY